MQVVGLFYRDGCVVLSVEDQDGAEAAHEELHFFRHASEEFDYDFYALPFELSINRRLKRFIPVAKPKVDAKQLEPAVRANCP